MDQDPAPPGPPVPMQGHHHGALVAQGCGPPRPLARPSRVDSWACGFIGCRGRAVLGAPALASALWRASRSVFSFAPLGFGRISLKS